MNLRRSALYVPGDSEKMLQRAARIDADVLLLNLEDGVASSRKEAARENVAKALRNRILETGKSLFGSIA